MSFIHSTTASLTLSSSSPSFCVCPGCATLFRTLNMRCIIHSDSGKATFDQCLSGYALLFRPNVSFNSFFHLICITPARISALLSPKKYIHTGVNTHRPTDSQSVSRPNCFGLNLVEAGFTFVGVLVRVVVVKFIKLTMLERFFQGKRLFCGPRLLQPAGTFIYSARQQEFLMKVSLFGGKVLSGH